jgi:DNA-binding PadR family transcriptional regulator
VVSPAALPQLSLTEWAVLATLAEGPTHGFAISRELASDGDLGRIWTVPRPLVYRALGVLEQRGLLEPIGSEGGFGPRRTVLRVSRAGRTAVERWLRAPVAHVRDLRTELLLRLRLLQRRGRDLQPLAVAQLAILTPILDSLSEQAKGSDGFDRVLAAWRREAAEGAARFLRGLIEDPPAATPSRP